MSENNSQKGSEMNRIASLFITFFRIGAFTFGGGYAMISLLEHECVEKKKWISSDELMEITIIAESTPGPIAINCATYTGYKMSGIAGAIAATLGVVLPSFILILLISGFFENILSVKLVANAFKGIRIAVAFLIMQTAVKMIKKMFKNPLHKKAKAVIAALFFTAVIAMDLIGAHISTVYLILVGGIIGFVLFGIMEKKEKKQ